MKKFAILTMLAVFVLALAAIGFAGEGEHPKGEKGDAPKVFDTEQKAGDKATCPVSGETFTIDEKTLHSEYKGQHVYFCCAGCKPMFDKDPENYLKK